MDGVLIITYGVPMVNGVDVAKALRIHEQPGLDLPAWMGYSSASAPLPTYCRLYELKSANPFSFSITLCAHGMYANRSFLGEERHDFSPPN
jgi:hypothetical protein